MSIVSRSTGEHAPCRALRSNKATVGGKSIRALASAGVFSVVVAAGLSLASAAFAAKPDFDQTIGALNVAPSSAMGQGSFVLAPMGHVKFCLDNPSQCQTTEAVRLKLDSDLWSLALGVNRRVNAKITAQPEAPGEDAWLLNQTYGDCDDYAVQKRHDLMAQGVPASALLLATAVTGAGENHLVLVLATDKGDYVLDNLRSDIRPWAKTGYRWLSRQTAENPKFWASVQKTPGNMLNLPVIALNGEKSIAPALVAEAKPAAPATPLAVVAMAEPTVQNDGMLAPAPVAKPQSVAKKPVKKAVIAKAAPMLPPVDLIVAQELSINDAQIAALKDVAPNFTPEIDTLTTSSYRPTTPASLFAPVPSAGLGGLTMNTGATLVSDDLRFLLITFH